MTWNPAKILFWITWNQLNAQYILTWKLSCKILIVTSSLTLLQKNEEPETQPCLHLPEYKVKAFETKTEKTVKKDRSKKSHCSRLHMRGQRKTSLRLLNQHLTVRNHFPCQLTLPISTWEHAPYKLFYLKGLAQKTKSRQRWQFRPFCHIVWLGLSRTRQKTNPQFKPFRHIVWLGLSGN